MIELIGLLAKNMTLESIVKELEHSIDLYKKTGDVERLEINCMLTVMHLNSMDKTNDDVLNDINRMKRAVLMEKLKDN